MTTPPRPSRWWAIPMGAGSGCAVALLSYTRPRPHRPAPPPRRLLPLSRLPSRPAHHPLSRRTLSRLPPSRPRRWPSPQRRRRSPLEDPPAGGAGGAAVAEPAAPLRPWRLHSLEVSERWTRFEDDHPAGAPAEGIPLPIGARIVSIEPALEYRVAAGEGEGETRHVTRWVVFFILPELEELA